MRGRQRFVAGTLIVVGFSLAVAAGVFFLRNFCKQRFAENVCLIEEPGSESYWTLTETARGHLIRVRNGRFAGWYLASDDLVNATGFPTTTTLPIFLGGRRKPGPYVRNLVLRDRPGADCYWTITATEGGSHIQATDGRYRDWYLDFLDEYIPDIGSNPRTSWNLVLNENAVEGAVWKLKGTVDGHSIQATVHSFDGWYLDSLRKAKILERNVCWGVEERKDGQSPPLAE